MPCERDGSVTCRCVEAREDYPAASLLRIRIGTFTSSFINSAQYRIDNFVQVQHADDAFALNISFSCIAYLQVRSDVSWDDL